MRLCLYFLLGFFNHPSFVVFRRVPDPPCFYQHFLLIKNETNDYAFCLNLWQQ